ncbi:MAG TPA: hypothetical protein VGB07_02705 [Blastocatellia bacterium]
MVCPTGPTGVVWAVAGDAPGVETACGDAPGLAEAGDELLAAF